MKRNDASAGAAETARIPRRDVISDNDDVVDDTVGRRARWPRGVLRDVVFVVIVRAIG